MLVRFRRLWGRGFASLWIARSGGGCGELVGFLIWILLGIGWFRIG